MSELKTNWQNRGKGHRGRLRDRYLERGLDALSDAEVIELLLSFGTPRADCTLQSRELLARFGSFAAVFDASPQALQGVKGVGPKNSFAVSFVQAAAARYLNQRLQGKSYLNSSAEVIEYLSYRLRGLKKEHFYAVYLDASHGIICTEAVAEGSLSSSVVYPRELLSRIIHHHAAAVIIAHNHPSGSLTPSQSDKKLTSVLYLLCQAMQVNLLDHIVIGNGSYSFADHGLIQDIAERSRQTLTSLYPQ